MNLSLNKKLDMNLIELSFLNGIFDLETITVKSKSDKDFIYILKTILSKLNEFSIKNKSEFILTFTYKKESYKIEFYEGLDTLFDINSFRHISLFKEFDMSNFFRTLKNISRISEDNDIFYDCNFPIEKEGFTIEEVDLDLYKYIPIVPSFDGNTGGNRTHYIKWEFNSDVSIRYFIQFQDKPSYEGKYFWKSHSEKKYVELTKNQAMLMIQKMGFKDQIEIVGKLINGKYYKGVIADFSEDLD